VVDELLLSFEVLKLDGTGNTMEKVLAFKEAKNNLLTWNFSK
jgi:hypothetical protein